MPDNNGRMSKNKVKFSTYDIALIGLTAALVFISTNFRITIPTGVNNSMIHLGNIFCLIAAVVLGGLKGGIAAGIGSMMFDLFSEYAMYAPITLVNKFVMALLCGILTAKLMQKMEKSKKWAERRPLAIGLATAVGSLCGLIAYNILYILSNFYLVSWLIQGNTFEATTASAGTTLLRSIITTPITMLAAALLAPVFVKANDEVKRTMANFG